MNTGLLLFNQAKPEAGMCFMTCFGFAFYYFDGAR
jgi:hypothetical protein